MSRLDPTRRALLGALLFAIASAAVLNALGYGNAWSLQSLLRGDLLFFSFALTAALAIHLGPLPISAWPRELAFAAATAAVLSLGGLSLGRVTVALGYYALVRRGLMWLRAPPEARPEHLRVLCDAALLVLYGMLLQTMLAITAAVHPVVLDPLVYAAEAGFGFQPSEVMGRFFRATPALFWFWGVVYTGLPLAMGFVHAAHQRRWPEGAPAVLRSVLAIGVSGYCLYLVFPVVGPFYVRAAGMDLAGLAVAPTLVATTDPRNCMPSLHVSWALVLFFHTLRLGFPMRAFGLVFLVLTAITTLGFEFHYLLDLIVAAPFAVAVDGLASVGRQAVGQAAIAAVLVAVWLVVIRFFPVALGQQGALLWAATVLTVGTAVVLRRQVVRLANAP